MSWFQAVCLGKHLRFLKVLSMTNDFTRINHLIFVYRSRVLTQQSLALQTTAYSDKLPPVPSVLYPSSCRRDRGLSGLRQVIHPEQSWSSSNTFFANDSSDMRARQLTHCILLLFFLSAASGGKLPRSSFSSIVHSRVLVPSFFMTFRSKISRFLFPAWLSSNVSSRTRLWDVHRDLYLCVRRY